MIRDPVNFEFIDNAMTEIYDKLIFRINQKGGGIYSGPHETYGIIAEEFNKELLDALHANDREQFRKELIDIGVAVIFGMASMDTGDASKDM